MRTQGNFFSLVSCATLLALLGGLVGTFKPADAAQEREKQVRLPG
jgi:hypothetical protein